IDIGSVLHYANQHCSFMEAFDHILGRYAKQPREDHVLVACLIAWGTNMGLGRMGEISHIRYPRSEARTSEIQSRFDLVCRLLLGNKNADGLGNQSEIAAGVLCLDDSIAHDYSFVS